MKLLPLILICLFSIYCNAQESSSKPSIKVHGEVMKPLILNADDLNKMKRNTVILRDRNNKSVSFTGAALQEILQTAGVTMGKELRGENLAKYVLVKCADGYEVVFSLAELDSSFTDRMVILAYESEGMPLPAERGPFRLVVPGEKKPARSSYQVVEFIVRYAKE